MPVSPQISDSYTETFHIPGRGPWSPLTGKYRPAMPEAVWEYQDATTAGKKRMPAAVKLLLGGGTDPLIREWDLKDKNDVPIPISEAAIKKIPAPMLDRLLNIVSGYALEETEGDGKNG